MNKDIVKELCEAIRRQFNTEEKIRIVLEGLRGEIPVTELCRREGITLATRSSIIFPPCVTGSWNVSMRGGSCHPN